MAIKKYFYHSKHERLAAYFLLTGTLILFFIPKIYSFFYEKGSFDFSPYKAKIDIFEANLREADSLYKAQYTPKEKKVYTNYTYTKQEKVVEKTKAAPNIIYTNFDPNTASEKVLQDLGLKANTIKSIINYRAKGGQFRIKTDLKKIYTLAESDYLRLESYISLPDTIAKKECAKAEEKTFKEEKTISPFPKKISIEINSASIEDFQQLHGIGPAWSKKIVNFREKLGGFKNVEQVAELYNFPDSVYQKILPFIVCDNSKINCLSLNQASVESLAAHPYLSNYQARAIVKWRESLGTIERVDFVFTIPELDDKNKTAARIFPYLCL